MLLRASDRIPAWDVYDPYHRENVTRRVGKPSPAATLRPAALAAGSASHQSLSIYYAGRLQSPFLNFVSLNSHTVFVMPELQPRFKFPMALATLAATSALTSPVAAQQQRTPFETALLRVEPHLIDAVAPVVGSPLRMEANTRVRAFLRNVNDVYATSPTTPRAVIVKNVNPTTMLYPVAAIPPRALLDSGQAKASVCVEFDGKVLFHGTLGLDGKLGPAMLSDKPYTGPLTPQPNGKGGTVSACVSYTLAYIAYLKGLGVGQDASAGPASTPGR